MDVFIDTVRGRSPIRKSQFELYGLFTGEIPCLRAANLFSFVVSTDDEFMTLDETIRLIRTCAKEMSDRYGKSVFDEWAIISLLQQQARILAYIGPRNDEFLRNFADDLGALRAELLNSKYHVGDFEFARHGEGTKFEAFLVLGKGTYLICNNTQATMHDIAKDPRWLDAQVPFTELGDKVRSSPLACSV